MNKIKKALKKLSVLISVAMLSTSAIGSTTASASGIFSLSGTLNGCYQHKSMWCWAASAETSAKYMVTSHKTQEQVVTYVKGSDANQTGDIEDIAFAANYFVNGSGSNYNFVGYYNAKSFAFLKAQVMLNKVPIIGGWEYLIREGAYNNHATTVYMVTENSDGTRGVGYYDPADNSNHICSFDSYSDGTYNGIRWEQTCYA